MSEDSGKSRQYVSQEDVPRVTLEEALRIPRVISDYFANEATKPLRVAEAMEISPKGSRFRELCGASIGYGLTDGGAYAEEISLTDLGRRIVAPTVEGDDKVALKEAVLKPTVIRKFLEKYNNAKLPPNEIAENVLVEDMDVPRRKAGEAYELILENADALGFIREVKGKKYVDLEVPESFGSKEETDEDEDADPEVPVTELTGAKTNGGTSGAKEDTSPEQRATGTRRVFITHGKNMKIVEQLKELLTFGDFEPVVAVEEQGVSKPVPQKVMEHMRSCSAAIIHVGTEKKVLDEGGDEHRMLNPNVLIEIGAAMALYENRFILLVEDGVNLPSNLQGLHEVRYEGETLDYDGTMRLLKAINEIKK